MQNLVIWFLIFIVYSVGGWLVEVIVTMLEHRKFVNRGFLIGPLCPIYGTGAVIASLILNGHESPLVIFCVSLVGGAILEYSAGYLMEKMFRVRWWDYSKKPFNVNGRICLESVLSFGFAGILIIKFITPFLLHLFGQLPVVELYALGATLLTLILIDIGLSLWLILGVKVTVGTVQKDATDEISERVREVLMGKGKLNRRLVKAFPNQTPSKKPAHRPKSKTQKS